MQQTGIYFSNLKTNYEIQFSSLFQPKLNNGTRTNYFSSHPVQLLLHSVACHSTLPSQ